MTTSIQGQSVNSEVHARRSLSPPTSDFLVLSNATGVIRVLDSRGLVLESNLVYLPRIKLSDLSLDQLGALLETKTAYSALTVFGSLNETNAQGPVLEKQLRQIWSQGNSLAERIQTRLEIVSDLREYNLNLALLPGTLAAANQYGAHADAVNDRLTNRIANVVVAAAQVETAEQDRAAGLPDARQGVQQARDTYQVAAARLERATDRAMIVNGQAAGANQQVAENLTKCAALSARLAKHGIQVPSAPPFYPIPPLAMEVEVDKARTAN